MKTIFPLLLIVLFNNNTEDNQTKYKKAKVNFSDFEKLVEEVKEHRAQRLLSFDDFSRKSKDPNVIILDTRSEKMYNRKHIKGAKHLSFSDFTESNLKAIIPDKNKTILIYCNNNFEGDEINFMSKSIKTVENKTTKELTLALNIPTYINLYGYGYKNVYELDELISNFDQRIEYEGTTINE